MKICSMDKQLPHIGGTAIALGRFDGVHLAHKRLLETAAAIAKTEGLSSALYTFSNNPALRLPRKDVKLITTNRQRLEYIQTLGISYVFAQRFTSALMHMPPRDFFNTLTDKLHCKAIVVGYSYRFGYKAGGDAQLLEQLCESRGIRLHIEPPLYLDGDPVSSTRVRTAIADGDPILAARLLGRNHALAVTHLRENAYAVNSTQCNYPDGSYNVLISGKSAQCRMHSGILLLNQEIPHKKRLDIQFISQINKSF